MRTLEPPLTEAVARRVKALGSVDIAAEVDAKACCVVDSDLRSITPEWVELLLEPITSHGFEFVAPLYGRHRYDGTITNTIVYPLTRALYGKRVRQPIGGDFGFSGALAARFLEFEDWEGPIAQYGIDVFMTTTALAEGRRVAQSFLGAKTHDPKDPGSDLAPMLVQVVSCSPSVALGDEAWVRIIAETEAGTADDAESRLEELALVFERGKGDLVALWGAAP